MPTFPRLVDLHPLTRLGVALLVATLLGGYAVSGLHMAWHYDNRDESPGLTVDDIRGHYHGLTVRSPLVDALDAGHPEDLPDRERSLLLQWLANPAALSAAYDDFDLGDDAPAEIIANSCLSCHARAASGPDAFARLPLEYFDDVQPLTTTRVINPTTTEIVAMSQHTHAPVMALVLIVMALLGAMTRAPRGLGGFVVFAGGAGLLIDMAAWWLARGNDAWVYAIIGGGFVYTASTVLLGAVVIVDCLIPGRRLRE